MRKPPSEDGFDSDEERYFSWWLDELLEAGYVESWTRGETYELVPAIVQPYVKTMISPVAGRVSSKIANVTIKTRLKYTPDFEIRWKIKAFGLLFVSHPGLPMDGPVGHHFLAHCLGGLNPVSIIEVKPSTAGVGKMNSSRFTAARMNAMFLYDKHGLYANLVEVGNHAASIFAKTFTPKRFLTTNKTGKPRSLQFQPRDLGRFVAETPKLKPVFTQPS